MNLVTRVSLGQTLLKNVPVILPPCREQQKIGEYLEKAYNILDDLIEKYKGEINLMEEYRTRLISDVVTGKLNVQGIKVSDFIIENGKHLCWNTINFTKNLYLNMEDIDG